MSRKKSQEELEQEARQSRWKAENANIGSGLADRARAAISGRQKSLDEQLEEAEKGKKRKR